MVDNYINYTNTLFLRKKQSRTNKNGQCVSETIAREESESGEYQNACQRD